jgi:hypothetical protein
MLAIVIAGIMLASMIFAPKIYGTLPVMRGAKRSLSSRFHTGAPRASQVPSVHLHLLSVQSRFAYSRSGNPRNREINKRNTSTIFFLATMSKLSFLLLCLCGFSCRTSAWTAQLNRPSRNDFSCATRCFQSLGRDDADDLSSPEVPSDAQRQNAMMLEEMSLKGAARIAKMTIPERAKRALLAEAAEDRIFELSEVLEGFVDENGMVREENREKAVEFAKETKRLQIQYNDLVSGNPSTVLQALDTLGSRKD